MFILENPYVSKLLLETLEKNQYEVLKNSIAENFNDYKLNLIDESSIDSKNLRIYSNSENSIDWVLKNHKNSDIARLINICKNKYEFRKSIADIYPDFFFKEILLDELETIDITDFPNEFIIKPSIGFLSMGVHKVNSHNEWKNVVKLIQTEIKDFAKNFPKKVLSSSSFIVEEIIKGDEFAVDAYYDEKNKPVIMNIFQHPFVSADDVSDRAYITSKEIIEENLENFEDLLSKIGQKLDIKNFPVHIELIKDKNGKVVPVEINPMRFAGWCTTDTAYYAYGINMYEYFVNNKKPDWNELLKDKDGKIYYFAIAEVPTGIDKKHIKFDYDELKKNFSHILEFREIDFKTKPVFAILFGEAENYDEIVRILQIEINSLIENV